MLVPIVDRLQAHLRVRGVGPQRDLGDDDRGVERAGSGTGFRHLPARRPARTRVRARQREGHKIPLSIRCARGETRLFAKAVTVGGGRHNVRRNEAKDERNRADRRTIVEGIERQLKKATRR